MKMIFSTNNSRKRSQIDIKEKAHSFILQEMVETSVNNRDHLKNISIYRPTWEFLSNIELGNKCTTCGK